MYLLFSDRTSKIEENFHEEREGEYFEFKSTGF